MIEMSSPGIITIDTEPLIIRTNGNSANNNTYVVKTYDYPISSNYVLCTASMGELVPSDRIYISTITTSSLFTAITNTSSYLSKEIYTSTSFSNASYFSTLFCQDTLTTQYEETTSTLQGDAVTASYALITSTTVNDFNFSTLITNHFEYTSSIQSQQLCISTLDQLNISGDTWILPVLSVPVINASNAYTDYVDSNLLTLNQTHTAYTNADAMYNSTLSTTLANYLMAAGSLSVGLLSTSTDYALEVAGNINFTNNLYLNGQPYQPTIIDNSIWVASSFSLTYSKGGNIGIGTSTMGFPLTIKGNTRFTTLNPDQITSTLVGYSTALIVYSTSLYQYNSSVAAYNLAEIEYNNAYQSTTNGYNSSLVTYSTLQAQYEIDYQSTVVGEDILIAQYNSSVDAYNIAYQSTADSASTANGLYEEAYIIWENTPDSDFGVSWTTIDIDTTAIAFSGVAVSDIGQYQTISAPLSEQELSMIYYSSDSGNTWTQATADTDQDYGQVTMSLSGQYQACVSKSSGNLYVSIDSGAAWQAYPGTPSGQAIGCSRGPSAAFYVCYYGGSIYTTQPIQTSGIVGPLIKDQANNVDSFTAIYVTEYDVNIGYACSATTDGGKGSIYVLSDGPTWTILPNAPTNQSYTSICCDDTGRMISATTLTGTIWISSDSGFSWTAASAPTLRWISICCDYTGMFQMASSGVDGYIYYSSDYGSTWTVSDETASILWGQLAMSNDAYISVAIPQDGITIYENYVTELYGPGPEPEPPADPVYPDPPPPLPEIVYPTQPTPPDPPTYPPEPTPPSGSPPVPPPVPNVSDTALIVNGKMGIGTNTPNVGLQVIGTVNATTKNFDIPHPLSVYKHLLHSCIEGPRIDVLYRGIARLEQGQAIIDLEKASTQTEPMSEGTFDALTVNPQFFLQNMTSFDSVQGSIRGSLLTIQCEKTDSVDQISWIVVAERADPYVKEAHHTNDDGFLITES